MVWKHYFFFFTLKSDFIYLACISSYISSKQKWLASRELGKKNVIIEIKGMMQFLVKLLATAMSAPWPIVFALHNYTSCFSTSILIKHTFWLHVFWVSIPLLLLTLTLTHWLPNYLSRFLLLLKKLTYHQSLKHCLKILVFVTKSEKVEKESEHGKQF